MKKITLTIVSQEKQLLKTQVDQVSVPTTQGEVTILPNHIPLFSKLAEGELTYKDGADSQLFFVMGGFLSVSAESEVTVIADAASLARDISIQKAQEAVEQAKTTIATSTDRRELLMAEASLRRALLEIRIAQKTKRSSI